jgi:hypothetical protein
MLTAVAVALFVAYVAGGVVGERPGNRAGAAGLLLPGLAEDRVTRVRLRGAGGAVELERGADDAWFVVLANRLFPARVGAAQGLVDTLSSLAEGDPVTNDPELWPSFGVVPSASADVRAWNEDGRLIAHLLVGRITATGRRVYLRVEEMAQVRLVATELPFYLERDTGYWWDLRLLPEGVTGPRIVGVELRTERPVPTAYHVYRDERDVWHLSDAAGSVDQFAADEIANAVAVLRGAGFVTDPSREEIVTSTQCGEIRVNTAENRSFLLRLFCHDGAYYLRADRLPYTYQADRDALRSVLVPRSTLVLNGGSDGG